MGSRIFVIGIIAGAVLAGCSESRGPDDAGAAGPLTLTLPDPLEPPYERVVLVTIDTLRADHLASYGYFRKTSPFLDEIAERSLVFEHAMASSSHTGPSHASMLTGLPPSLHGLLRNGAQLSPELPTLASLHRAAGFETAAFTSVEFLAGAAGGFDSVRAKTTVAKGLANASIAWMRNQRTRDRFFMWLHFYEPHRWKQPGKVPTEHLETIRSQRASERADYANVAELHGLPDPEGGAFAPLQWRSGDRGGEKIRPASRAEVLELVDTYDAQIAYADAAIERVYDALQELALPGDTLWIVTSDHGEGLGSHDYAGHGWQVYNEQLHVPLILHSTSGAFAPRRVGPLVALVDLFPTLAELLGARVSGPLAPMLGTSMVPLITGDHGWERRPAFAERRPMDKPGVADKVFALQTRRHKLIHRTGGEDEFFDLEVDPLERLGNGDGGEERTALERELDALRTAFANSGWRPGTTEVIPDAWLEELRALGYAAD